MNNKAAIFLRVLGNRFHKGPIDVLLKKLPKEEAESVLSANITSNDILAPFIPLEKQIDPIHYSWFAPLIASEKADRQELLIGALPDQQAAGVCKLLRKSPRHVQLAPLLKIYLQKNLLDKVGKTGLLPLSYIPQNELSVLTQCSKKELVDIIDYLGMFDLAEEIRHIVNKHHLKFIYTSIQPKQYQFLRQCLQQKAKIKTNRLYLENWHGDRKELHKMLHPRGIARLGKSLHGQHPDFVWDIVHRLDTGRGARILHYSAEDEKQGVVFALASQVINVVNFLKKE